MISLALSLRGVWMVSIRLTFLATALRKWRCVFPLQRLAGETVQKEGPDGLGLFVLVGYPGFISLEQEDPDMAQIAVATLLFRAHSPTGSENPAECDHPTRILTGVSLTIAYDKASSQE